MNALVRANALALLLPLALMAGALGSQYIGGLYPCEMCHWQRWPHYAAILLAGLAFALPGQRRLLVMLAALAILVSGLIGGYHAGVEYRWWEGITTCSSTASGTTLEDLMRAPLIRCDQPQWQIFGVSLAGFNAILSALGAATILAMLRRAR